MDRCDEQVDAAKAVTSGRYLRSEPLEGVCVPTHKPVYTFCTTKERESIAGMTSYIALSDVPRTSLLQTAQQLKESLDCYGIEHYVIEVKSTNGKVVYKTSDPMDAPGSRTIVNNGFVYLTFPTNAEMSNALEKLRIYNIPHSFQMCPPGFDTPCLYNFVSDINDPDPAYLHPPSVQVIAPVDVPTPIVEMPPAEAPVDLPPPIAAPSADSPMPPEEAPVEVRTPIAEPSVDAPTPLEEAPVESPTLISQPSFDISTPPVVQGDESTELQAAASERLSNASPVSLSKAWWEESSNVSSSDNSVDTRELATRSRLPPLENDWCKFCYKPGHRLRDMDGQTTCPKLLSHKCSKCGDMGHIAKYCDYSPPCEVCGKKGHTKATCHSVQRNTLRVCSTRAVEDYTEA